MSPKSCEDLLEIRAIEQLKYRYLRALDSHDWDLMRRCLAEDVQVSLGNGAYQYRGRESVVGWLRDVGDSFYASHAVFHPEVAFTSSTTATGLWRMQDVAYFTKANPDVQEGDIQGGEKFEAAAYYHDTYRKIGGDWLIQSTGYMTIYEALSRPDFSTAGQLKLDPLRGVRPAST